jgi:hypothetical protein
MAEKLSDRITRVEESSKSAHKRIDKAEDDILIERNAKHDIYSKLHTHAGILVGIEGAVNKLLKATELNTEAVLTFRVMAMTAIFMGSGFIGFVGFVGGKLLNWW